MNTMTNMILSAIENFESPGSYIFDTEYRFKELNENSFEFIADLSGLCDLEGSDIEKITGKKVKITVEII